jgi:TonB family protein
LKAIAASQIEIVYYRKAKAMPTADSMAVYVEELKSERPKSKYLAELYFDLGERYKQVGQYKKAIDPYRQAMTFPDTIYQADARLALAECYLKLSDWQTAAKEYLEFVRKFPNHKAVDGAFYYAGMAYFNIGENLHKNNDPAAGDYLKKALELFEKVRQRFPDVKFDEKIQKDPEFTLKEPEFAKTFQPGFRGPLQGRGILAKVVPEYPDWARVRGLTDVKIAIRLEVTPKGKIRSIKLELSSGYPQWDQSCMSDLLKWKFAPLPPDAKQEVQWGVITFIFPGNEE